MSLGVLHVLASPQPEAGSVAVCLNGLHQALAPRGVQSETLAAPGAVTRSLDDADVIHIHGWSYDLATRIAVHALRTGKPYVIGSHGFLTYGPYHKSTWRDRLRFTLRTRRLIRGASCLTVLNAEEEQDLQVRTIHPFIRRLPYGLNFSEYEVASDDGIVSPGAKWVLVLGPLHPRGGCVALLKAMAEMGRDADGWDVMLAGSDGGEWRKMLESAVRRKKGDDRVAFHAAPTIAEQRDLLARASLLVSPGLHIGPPVSIMQAVASGVPVIASTCTAPQGLDGAIRVCAPHREELRETLRSVFRLPDETRRAMGERARVVGRAVFDWSVLADQYARFYTEIAQKGPYARRGS